MLSSPLGQGWVGFAISETGDMVGSDAIIGLPDEDVSASNPGKYTLARQALQGVVLSEQQTLKNSDISQNDTHTVLSFTKFLEEEGELSINATGDNFFLVAAGSSNVLGYHLVRQPFQVTVGWPTADCGAGACNPCGSSSCNACNACNPCGGGCGCGSNCGGCGCGSTGNGSTEASSHGIGTYEPLFQHYTMIIPEDPGMPGDSQPMGDDVIGILANGVLLDSHQQTFAYDSCNGHSDKKHQYRKIIFALLFVCFLSFSEHFF